MFDNLSERLGGILDRLTGRGALTEKDVDAAMREVRRALLELLYSTGARISEAVSESLYLEESLEAIVKTTMAAVGATGAALVLEDGTVAFVTKIHHALADGVQL